MAHLVFQTAFPGDLYLSIPLLKRLRAWDPGQRLVLACRPGLGDYFVNKNLVDEILEIDKKTAAGRKRAVRDLKRETWDLVVVPHASLRTALWIHAVKARQGKIGFARWWNRFAFTRRVTKPEAYPEALRQLSLLTPVDPDLAEWFGDGDLENLKNLATQNSPVRFKTPKIPAWASMRVGEPRPQGEKRILLAPGSVWGTKRWTKQGYAELGRLLLEKKYKVELVGSPEEFALGEEIVKITPGLINRIGKTKLSDLADGFAGATALVCNDSGAMHVAATVDLPTVAIFGPTTLELGFRPWSNVATVVQRTLSCRPCGAHGPQKCPIGTHACRKEISARDVLRALERLL